MAAAPANMVCVPCRDPGLYCHCAGASAGCGHCVEWAHEHPEPTADSPHGPWDRRTRCTNSRAKQDRGVALPVCAGCRPYALIKPELRVIRDCCPPRAGQNVPIGNSPYILPVTASAASTAASSAAASPGVGPAAPGLQMPPYMQLPPIFTPLHDDGSGDGDQPSLADQVEMLVTIVLQLRSALINAGIARPAT